MCVVVVFWNVSLYYVMIFLHSMPIKRKKLPLLIAVVAMTYGRNLNGFFWEIVEMRNNVSSVIDMKDVEMNAITSCFIIATKTRLFFQSWYHIHVSPVYFQIIFLSLSIWFRSKIKSVELGGTDSALISFNSIHFFLLAK